MNVPGHPHKALSRALASLTPLDVVLAACGPLAIVLIWSLLPAGVPEGSWTADAAPAGVVAELVGYALPAGVDGLATLGRGEEADLRLHDAPIARRAAVVLPRRGGRAALTMLPADTGLTLRRIPPGLADEAGAPAVETSFRPWAGNGGGFVPLSFRPPETFAVGCARPEATLAPVRLRQLRLWGVPGDGLDEPEAMWIETEGREAVAGGAASVDAVACAGEGVWWKERGAPSAADPCTGTADGWKRVRSCWIGRPAVCLEPWSRAWGVRIANAGRSVTRTPWGESFRAGGLGVTYAGAGLGSIRVGLDASGCKSAGCDPAPRPVCAAGGGEPVAVLGPLVLGDGDVVGIGRTRFLVREDAGGMELLHVRRPRAPGYFRSAAGHDVYHPNRRATWPVPPCDGRRGALTLMVRPGEAAGGGAAAAELPARDRERLARIEAAARHHGVPQELPAVSGRLRGERALLSLCAAEDGEGEIRAVVAADSPRGVRLRAASLDEVLFADQADVPLGTRRRPAEALADLDGNLIRIAPAANVRLTRRLRLGLAGYLVFILVLQAVPLSRARAALRHRPRGVTAWPAALGAPTLQQLAGTGIILLLFTGANFQLLLALHPELAGKPDYLQAFLQGAVAVSAVLAACAGFAAGGIRLPERCAAAALGAALALFGAAAWRAWDAWGVPRGLWLTALRDRAVASSGAGPAAFGSLLVRAGGGALALAVVFFASAALRWPRWGEWIARRLLAAPAAGFLGLAAGGLAAGLFAHSALAFELGILGGLAWYAGVYWAFVRRGRLPCEDHLRRRAAVLSLGSGLVMLGFLVVFFLVGADLPDAVSFLSVAVGLGLAGAAARIMVAERFTSLLRVVVLWGVATVFGCGFAGLVLTDMGSVAAWVPALLAGLFLWLVRPEEQAGRREEPRKGLCQLLLALGLGLVLLGLLDVAKTLAQGLEWQALDRPRQRLDLAEDVSYITAGEWVTEVRWLASHQDGALRWVPNVNSDVAVFGLAAGLGTWLAVLASVLVLAVAGCAALAADQALREGLAAARRGDRLWPALYRGLGLLSGMVAVLLVAQWLVHLSTGVVLHLPITGLVFPWVSHGNATHLLYAAAVVAPMAAAAALGGRTGTAR